MKKTYKFSLISSSGDAAYLCYKKVSFTQYEYFHNNELDLKQFALDSDYSLSKSIPEEMEPFNPGDRAAFGHYDCGMTVDKFELFVENKKLNFNKSYKVPAKSVFYDMQKSQILNEMKKGIYAVGYEGLEDCSIIGTIQTKSDFDIKKFKVNYIKVDYVLGYRDMISSITYDGKELEWELDSYEGTGDNNFGFVIVN
jgi:hypothetical protein